MLNEAQATDLLDALENAIEIAKTKDMDASVTSLGSNSWVALPTKPDEYFDQTLIRVCYSTVRENSEDISLSRSILPFVKKQAI